MEDSSHCDKELTITHESHLTDGNIARLIEGTLNAAESRSMLEHLHSCRRCFETYQDSVLYSHLFESDSPAFASTKKTAEAGLGVMTGVHDTGAARKERKRFSPVWRPALRIAAACVVVLAAAVIWHRNVERDGGLTVSSTDLAPIRAALETASRWGPHVLPEGERLLDGSGPAYRSGAVPLNDSLKSSLDHLYTIYRSEGASSDVVYFLAAGKYVTGQIDIARDLAAHARERYPDDQRIAVLEALISYTDGDHDRSIDLFRKVLDKNPDDPVANLDLAIVLMERGLTGEARAILERVEKRRAGTALASRAQSLLRDIENR